MPRFIILPRKRSNLAVLLALLWTHACKNPSPNEEHPRFRIFANHRVGFMDSTGRTIISPRYDMVGYFTENMAPAKEGKKWGFIDTHGAFVLKPQWEDAGNFSSGIACVKLRREREKIPGHSNSFRDKEVWTLIDRNGHRINNVEFEPCFHGTRASVPPRIINGRLCVETQEGYSYLDHHGTLVLGPYFQASPFNKGKALISTGSVYCIIDPMGNKTPVSLSGNYSIQKFSDGLAIVHQLNGVSKMNYLNQNGEIAFPTQWNWASPYWNGFAVVQEGARELLIDSSGTIRAVTPSGYSLDNNRSAEGFTVVKKPCFQNSCLGYMDISDGKIVLPTVFLEAGAFHYGLAWVAREDPPQAGYIDHSGNFVWKAPTPSPLQQQILSDYVRLEEEILYPNEYW